MVRSEECFLSLFIERAGGVSRFAAQCGLSINTAYRLIHGLRVSTETRKKVEAHCGLTLEQLRRRIPAEVLHA